ncbi:SRPBCC domain-containing protein [Streptomyces sp. NPDC006296]|uniref:SRPBCC domain-containing protein n=1 Tax=Streptomyces sp. NPDC006296 TaxID=3156746 RepID=UPI0033B784B2
MEHEVFVPVPVPALRRTLADPGRVARCVPGFQRDADASAGPLAGRLRFRAGGHTITYRGALTLRPFGGGDSFAVSGEGTEARGAGSAKLALNIVLTAADGGTTIAFTGVAGGDGRIVDLDAPVALAAAQRLLDRFTQQLVTESLSAQDGAADAGGPGATEPDPTATGAAEPSPGPSSSEPSSSGPSSSEPGSGGSASADEPSAGPGAPSKPGADEPGASSAGPDAPSADAPSADAPDTDAPSADAPDTDAPDAPSAGTPSSGPGSADPSSADRESVFDAPVPPSSLDPSEELEFTVPDEPPAEAAHARRTMIGRSTEEVDHAPPRGRYAPVPSPEEGVAGLALRWAAPAAALAIASAVVVGRALRRRRL